MEIELRFKEQENEIRFPKLIGILNFPKYEILVAYNKDRFEIYNSQTFEIYELVHDNIEIGDIRDMKKKDDSSFLMITYGHLNEIRIIGKESNNVKLKIQNLFRQTQYKYHYGIDYFKLAHFDENEVVIAQKCSHNFGVIKKQTGKEKRISNSIDRYDYNKVPSMNIDSPYVYERITLKYPYSNKDKFIHSGTFNGVITQSKIFKEIIIYGVYCYSGFSQGSEESNKSCGINVFNWKTRNVNRYRFFSPTTIQTMVMKGGNADREELVFCGRMGRLIYVYKIYDSFGIGFDNVRVISVSWDYSSFSPMSQTSLKFINRDYALLFSGKHVCLYDIKKSQDKWLMLEKFNSENFTICEDSELLTSQNSENRSSSTISLIGFIKSKPKGFSLRYGPSSTKSEEKNRLKVLQIRGLPNQDVAFMDMRERCFYLREKLLDDSKSQKNDIVRIQFSDGMKLYFFHILWL